jgi:hypothetical protein
MLLRTSPYLECHFFVVPAKLKPFLVFHYFFLQNSWNFNSLQTRPGHWKCILTLVLASWPEHPDVLQALPDVKYTLQDNNHLNWTECMLSDLHQQDTYIVQHCHLRRVLLSRNYTHMLASKCVHAHPKVSDSRTTSYTFDQNLYIQVYSMCTVPVRVI